MNINLHEALKRVNWKKSEYFKWKHDIRYDQRLPKKTEEDFLKMVNLKTLNSFIQWERTVEYKQLLLLLLDSRIADDMHDIYHKVSTKAKKDADKNSVELFLKLKKEISTNAKNASKAFSTPEDSGDDGDDLILE